MSATIESDLFSMYFAVPVRGRVEGAPVVSVDGKSFPVVESYLDDLKNIGVSLCLIPFYSSCLYKRELSPFSFEEWTDTCLGTSFVQRSKTQGKL